MPGGFYRDDRCGIPTQHSLLFASNRGSTPPRWPLTPPREAHPLAGIHPHPSLSGCRTTMRSRPLSPQPVVCCSAPVPQERGFLRCGSRSGRCRRHRRTVPAQRRALSMRETETETETETERARERERDCACSASCSSWLAFTGANQVFGIPPSPTISFHLPTLIAFCSRHSPPPDAVCCAEP